MTLLPFFDWCQETALAQLVRNSPVYSPIVDVLHLFGLILVFGPVMLINLRLGGVHFAGSASGGTGGSIVAVV